MQEFITPIYIHALIVPFTQMMAVLRAAETCLLNLKLLCCVLEMLHSFCCLDH